MTVITCPRCRAANSLGSSQCFLCDGSLVGIRSEDSESTKDPHKASGVSFHLATLMLVIALVAVGLGVAIAVPGLAVVLVIPAIIAACRTITLPGRIPGGDPTSLRFVASFLATFAVVVLLMVSGVVAFFATCLGIVSLNPGQYGGPWAGVGLICGVMAGIVVPIGLTIAIYRWRRKRSTPEPRYGRRD